MPTQSKSKLTLGKLFSILFEWPIVELIAEGWKHSRKLWNGHAHEGMYEVIEHEVTLELLDSTGKKAKVKKHQKVRFLHNNIIAYQDQGWGDGKIFVDYHCSPGIVADKYQLGHKELIVISLRKVRNRGDLENFKTEWKHLNGYTRSTEQWETEISHKTDYLKLKIIFPSERPASKIFCSERLLKRTKQLKPESIGTLADGRHYASFEVENPRLYEGYGFHWEW